MGFEEKMVLTGEPEDEEEEDEEEEDMVDPLEVVRDKCAQAEHCVHARAKLEDCESRVGSKSETREDCTEELLTSSMRGTTVWLTKSSILSSKVPPAPCTTGGSSRSDIDNYHLTEIPGFKGFL